MTVHWPDVTARKRDALVAVIAAGPTDRHGVIDQINEWSGAGTSTPAVQRHLRDLVDMGLVHSDDRGNRTTFRPTDRGRDLVDSRFGEMAAALESTEGVPPRA